MLTRLAKNNIDFTLVDYDNRNCFDVARDNDDHNLIDVLDKVQNLSWSIWIARTFFMSEDWSILVISNFFFTSHYSWLNQISLYDQTVT